MLTSIRTAATNCIPTAPASKWVPATPPATSRRTGMGLRAPSKGRASVCGSAARPSCSPANRRPCWPCPKTRPSHEAPLVGMPGYRCPVGGRRLALRHGQGQSQAAAACAPAPAMTGGGGLDFADQKSGAPLEVYADQGLELSQDAKTVIGRVNAKAIRGNVTVTGDVLTAHYREKAPPPGRPPPPKPVKTDGKRQAGQRYQRGLAGRGRRPCHHRHADPSGLWRPRRLQHRRRRRGPDRQGSEAADAVRHRDGEGQPGILGTSPAGGGARRRRRGQRRKAHPGRCPGGRFRPECQKQMAMQRAHGYDHVILTTPREIVTGDRAD